jgi:hypothetical protein
VRFLLIEYAGGEKWIKGHSRKWPINPIDNPLFLWYTVTTGNGNIHKRYNEKCIRMYY